MASLLACIPGLGWAASALSTMCCCVSGIGCVVNCFCCLIPCRSSTNTRFMYAFILLIDTIAAWALKYWGDQLVPIDYQTCSGACFQYLAVYRISFGLVLFHIAMVVITMFAQKASDIPARIHNGFWPLKLLILGALTVACFYIPTQFYHAYAYIAIILGIIFLILQTIVILDFAWTWAEVRMGSYFNKMSWVAKYENNDDVFWKCMIIFVTVFCYAATIAGSVVLYVYYTRKPGCGLNVFFLTFNLAISIVISIISVLPRVQEANPKSGIMQASIIAAYSTYIVASAIGSEPSNADFNCVSSPSGGANLSQVLFYLGFGCTLLAISISAWSTGGSDESLLVHSSEQVDEEAVHDEEDKIKYTYWLYHLVFIGAAGYMAALLNNWAVAYNFDPTSSSSSGSNAFEVNQGFAAVWVKMATSWVICLLYLWTLLAPVMMPERFGQ